MAARPYWRYVAVADGSTRPTHSAMHGTIFPADHSFLGYLVSAERV